MEGDEVFGVVSLDAWKQEKGVDRSGWVEGEGGGRRVVATRKTRTTREEIERRTGGVESLGGAKLSIDVAVDPT